MSSVLFIQPVSFGSDPNIKDNVFATDTVVNDEKQMDDQKKAFGLLSQLTTRIADGGVQTCLLCNKDEPRGDVTYKKQNDAIFPNNCISFHNFTDGEGKIVRRLVILYPMSLYRRHELPKVQLLDKLEAAADEGKIELLDLRGFESENRAFEGTGVLIFSADSRYVYMSRSRRSDDALLDMVCSPQYLNIPKENRFVFTSATPRADGGFDTVYHTNVLGWCGKDICAWATELITFDSEDAKRRFHDHLKSYYKTVINYTPEEIAKFAGNAFELATRDATTGQEKRFLCISQTAVDNMSPEHRATLEAWYGVDGIYGFPAEFIERRTGGSIRCMMGASLTHGPVLPSLGQQTTLDVAGIHMKDA